MATEVTPKKPPDWKNLTDTVQDAESLRQESINAHHDHLITEIETSDGPLGTSLRWEAFECKNTRNQIPEAPVIIFPEKPLEVSVSPVYCIVLPMYGMLFFGALDGASRLIKKNYRRSSWSMSMSTHPLWIFSSRFTAYNMQQTCSKYDIRMDDLWAAVSYMVKSCNLWLVKTCGGFGLTNLISENIKVGRSSTITKFHYIAWLPS